MWTVNFKMFKLVLENAGAPEIILPASAGSSKEWESSRKTSISPLLTLPKPLTVWMTRNCGKFWKRWEYQTTWPASWEICMQVKKQQFLVIHTVKGFGIVNKAEIDVFLELSCSFLIIQQMLAIWSLVSLPFLKPAWTSASSQFTYYRSSYIFTKNYSVGFLLYIFHRVIFQVV